MAGEKLQEGIYWQSGATPPAHLRILFLNFGTTVTAEEADQALTLIWSLYERLKNGKVCDLAVEREDEPDFSVPHGNLRAMLGFGVRLFDRRSHLNNWIDFDQRPGSLGGRLRGGVERPFRALHWAERSDPKIAQSDIMIQLTADSDLAVNRFIVEIIKLISDEGLELSISTFISGFHRDDRRSWIDFHDGVNNMKSDDRPIAMEENNLDNPWMVGGTYVAFLKIAVDLLTWRRLTRIQQEIIVGRTKLTGCPLIDTRYEDNNINFTTIKNCPTTGNIPSDLSVDYLDPPRPTDGLVRASHIHRSNQNRGSADQDSNNRIYRQGYEFLDPCVGGAIAGLNFIGFQRNLASVRNILNIQSWMGGVNFGGPEEITGSIEPIKLMSLIAGGFYAVPPKGNPYPGASLFRESM